MAALLFWTKFLHLTSLLVWCAALFALPALFALHPSINGRVERRRIQAATRFTFIAVGSPAAVIAVASGTGLIFLTASYGGWMLAKLSLVALMVVFHVLCGQRILNLHRKPWRWAPAQHIAWAGAPALLIVGVLWLVLLQPRLA